jgi:hypothetical protein
LAASAVTGGIVIGAMAAGTVLASLAVSAIYWGTFVATAYLASKSFGPKAPKTSGALGDTGLQTNYRDAAAARRIIYGRQKVGGPYALIHSSGTGNDILHLIVPFASHEINAVEQLFFNGEALTWDSGTGEVGGRFADHARIRVFSGTTSQAASTELVAECPDIWTSAHRLRGIAYLYVRLKYNQSIYTDGIPTVTAIVQGRKVYDPRTATTVYSTNPALCLRDYLTDTVLGVGIIAGEIDDVAFIAAANLSDESVSLTGGGTEARYTTNTIIDSSARPEDVIGQLLSASGGILTYSGGLWTHHAAGWRAPTLTLTQDHLAGPISISTKLSARDRCNGVKGTFIAEANQWQTADFPPVVNATYLSQDNGVRSWRDMPLPCTLSTSMAQRLAKIELERTRQEISCTLLCNLNAIGLRCGDIVNVTLPRYGWSVKPFEVTAWSFVQDGEPAALMISLSLRETASGVYDWSSGEETTVDLAPNTTLPTAYTTSAPSALTVSSTSTTQPDGTALSRITATWTPPSSVFWSGSGTRQVLEYQVSGDAGFTPWATLPGDANTAALPGVRPGISYRSRIRAENTVGATSAWVVSGYVTAAGDTTAPAVPTGVTVSGIYQGARVIWVNPTDADLAYVEVYEFTASTPVPNAGTAASARIYGTDYVRQGLAAGAVRFYWVRAVDASGNKSAWVGGTSATASAVDIPAASITSTQIADDSISTPKLQANSITAAKVGTNEIIATSANIANGVISTAKIADAAITSAKIGDAQIGTAKIGDLNVTTLKIANNAVTVPVSAYTAAVTYGTASTGYGAWCTVQTAVITSSGGPVFINLSFRVQDPAAYEGVLMRFRRNASATLWEWEASYMPTQTPLIDQPSAGTHSYTLEAYLVGNGSSPSIDSSVSHRLVTLMETKK